MLRLRVALFAVVALLLAAGCSHDLERVTLPPEAPMDDIRKIAVVGITNFTVDPGLGLLFEQAVASNLRASDRYEIIDSATARAAMARLGVSLDQLASPETAQEVGRAIGADALIWGSANYYFEDTRLSAPQCFNCGVPNRTPYWSVTQTTDVVATFQARVSKTSTGAIIWSNLIEGRESTTRTISINWSQAEPPPSSLLPSTDRADIPRTREAAVGEAADSFTKDLLPRQVWVRRDG